jgi:hypothetical protein
MDSAKIDELERLAAQATPGPWEHVGFGTVRGGCYIADCFGLSSRDERKIRQGMKNADYIVAACNSLPGLIAENRELRAKVQMMDWQMVWLAKQVCDSISPQEWINRAEQAFKEAGE